MQEMLKLLEGETLVARTKGLLINNDANGFDVLSNMKKLDILQFGKLLLYTHTNCFQRTLCCRNKFFSYISFQPWHHKNAFMWRLDSVDKLKLGVLGV